MDTIRPALRAPSAYTSSSPTSTSGAEAGTIEDWDDDIVRASRASGRKHGRKGDHSFADDVAQDIRLAVMLAIRKTGITHERYIRRVISNSAKNSARQTLVVSLEVSGLLRPELRGNPTTRDVLAERRVRQWVRAQPRPLQGVFHLLYRRGLSQREAAAHLGVSQPRIAKLHRQLLNRGLDELRDLAS